MKLLSIFIFFVVSNIIIYRVNEIHHRLSCFYDENHFCLCNDFDDQRVANCFEFNHTSHHDCFGLSNCENGARCLQDRPSCPQTSICVCPECFYGTRCQFSSSLFGLSLDAILGYHIQPQIRIGDQPTIVQVSVALTDSDVWYRSDQWYSIVDRIEKWRNSKIWFWSLLTRLINHYSIHYISLRIEVLDTDHDASDIYDTSIFPVFSMYFAGFFAPCQSEFRSMVKCMCRDRTSNYRDQGN